MRKAVTRAMDALTAALGTPVAVALSIGLVVGWIVGGFTWPGGHLDNTYQLILNSPTTSVAFIMGFVIQATQNRDSRANQTKMDAQARVLINLAAVHVDDLTQAEWDDVIELQNLIAIEDEPQAKIKSEQERVRGRRS